MSRPRISLSLKLSIFIALTVIATSVTLNIFWYRHDVTEDRENLDLRAITLANSLARSCEYGVLIGGTGGREILQPLVEGMVYERDVVYAIVNNMEDEILAEAHGNVSLMIPRYVGDLASQTLLTTDRREPFIQEVQLHNSRAVLRDIAVPIVTKRARVPSDEDELFAEADLFGSAFRDISEEMIGTVRLGISTIALAEHRQQTRRGAILLTLAVISIATALAMQLVRLAINPLRDLVLGTQRIARGDLRHRVREKSGDEIGDLARSFNRMAGDLERSRDEVEKYSHDLERQVEERTGEIVSAKEVAETETAKLEATLHSVADGVIVVDLSLGVKIVNDTAEEMLGVKEGTARDQHLFACFDHEPLRELIIRAVEDSQQTVIGEFALPEIHGEQRFCQTYVSNIFDRKDKPIGLIAVMRDTTKERVLEQIKTDFLATMSHELRTPLTSIIGFSDVLLGGEYGVFAEDQQDFLETINDQGKHLLNLINDLLDISRLEAGKVELKMESLNLAELMEQVIYNLQPVASGKNIQITNEVDITIPIIVADRQKIGQVLTNLIGNAVKFTPPMGRIAVALLDRADYVEVQVKDTGPGIPAEKIASLFSRFYQVDSGSTRVIGGSGLGLAITKELVSLHKGDVWVESTVGLGSKFCFTLPKTPEMKPDAHEVRATYAPAMDSLTLTLARDRESRNLQTCWLEPVRCNNAREAWETVEMGKAEMAVLPLPYVLHLRERGKAIKIVLLASRNGACLMAANAPLTADAQSHPPDLDLRKIGISDTYSAHNILLHRMLESAGLGYGSDIEVVSVPPPQMVELLSRKEIDGFLGPEPYCALAEVAEKGIVVRYSKDLWPDHPASAYVVSESFVQQHPEVVQELVDALVRTAQFIEEDPKEAARRSVAYFGVQSAVIERALTNPKGRTSYDDLRPRVEELEEIQRHMREMDLLQEDVNIEALVEIGFVEQTIVRRTEIELLGREQEAVQEELAPDRREPELAPEEVPQPVMESDRKTILIADDKEENLKLASTVLRKHYRIVEATDGAEALRKCVEENPDLIILDLMMPVMDGFETIARLKQADETRDIPTVALTARAMESERKKALEAGFDGVIIKPFIPSELTQKVDEVLDGHPEETEPVPTLDRTGSDGMEVSQDGRRDEKVVLVVDDDEGIVRLISIYLRREGFDVVTAFNGRDAIMKAREAHPDAITLDVMMSDKDGFEVLQELKSDPRTEDIPVVIVSVVEDAERGYSLGAADVLHKPVDEKELVATVRKLTGADEGKKILVVDDNPEIVKLIMTYLKETGHEAIPAYGGEEAVAKMKFDPDLIILDVMMPDLNGVDVIKRMEEEGRYIPVIILTAKDLSSQEMEALKVGFNKFLPKRDLTKDAFLRGVAETLGEVIRK